MKLVEHIRILSKINIGAILKKCLFLMIASFKNNTNIQGGISKRNVSQLFRPTHHENIK